MNKFILGALLLVSFYSCNSTTTTSTGDYYPTPYYSCQYFYDTYSGQYTYGCFWVYYSENGDQSQELDIVAEVSDAEDIVLNKTTNFYAEKYSLSLDAASKIARNVYDLEKIEDRSMDDLADFAKRLYGVNPSELVEAIGHAQVGENTQLNKLIEDAAIEFGTSNENMREVIKDLHNNALESSGISL